VVLTSLRVEPEMVRSCQFGMNACVAKRVDLRELVDALKELGVFCAIINEPPRGSVGKGG